MNDTQNKTKIKTFPKGIVTRLDQVDGRAKKEESDSDWLDTLAEEISQARKQEIERLDRRRDFWKKLKIETEKEIAQEREDRRKLEEIIRAANGKSSQEESVARACNRLLVHTMDTGAVVAGAARLLRATVEEQKRKNREINKH